MNLPDSVEDQTSQCLSNIKDTLSKAESCLEDVVKVTYYYTSREDFRKCENILKTNFYGIFPAATMVIVSGLYEERMKVEIEVTALRPQELTNKLT